MDELKRRRDRASRWRLSSSRYTSFMRTAVQPEARPTSSEIVEAARREQERLRATLSPEEFWKDRQRKIEEFNKLCEEASRQARANGLTEEILAEILAEDE